jgi:hypothetical protein
MLNCKGFPKPGVYMKNRCYNKKHAGYKNYGGKGITVCVEWYDSFVCFLKDMGERPHNKTLDRIDNSGNYCKDNCRWASKSEQQRNRSNFICLEAFGKKQTLNQWSDEFGIKVASIYWRIRNGWDIEDAISKKLRGNKSAGIGL